MRPDLLQTPALRVAERERAGLLRRVRMLDRARGTRVTLDGREVLNFCSNGYLGLAQDPRIAQALQAAAAETGVGAGGRAPGLRPPARTR